MVRFAIARFRLPSAGLAFLAVGTIVSGLGCHLSDRNFPRYDASPASEAASPIDGSGPIDGSAPIEGASLDGATPIDAPMTIDTGSIDALNAQGG